MAAVQDNMNETNGAGFFELLKTQFETELKSNGLSESSASELSSLLSDENVTPCTILQLMEEKDE